MDMDKAAIITQFRAQTQEEYDTLMRGKGIDTDPMRVQERLEQLKHSLSAIQEVREPAEIVEVGSLVTYAEVGKEFHCLILPGCMGDILEQSERKIACVSPDSHIAAALVGKKIGEEVTVQTGKIARKLKIVSIE